MEIKNYALIRKNLVEFFFGTFLTVTLYNTLKLTSYCKSFQGITLNKHCTNMFNTFIFYVVLR